MDIGKKVGKIISDKAKDIDVEDIKGTVAKATSALGDGLKKVSETLEPDQEKEKFSEAATSLSDELNAFAKNLFSKKEKKIIKKKQIYLSKNLENLKERGKTKNIAGYMLIFLGLTSSLNFIFTFTFNASLVLSIVFVVVGFYLISMTQTDKKRYRKFPLYYQCFGVQGTASFDDLATSVNGEKEDVVDDFQNYISEHILIQTHIDQKNEKIYITDQAFERSKLPDIPVKKEDKIETENQEELPIEIKEFIQKVDDYLSRIEKDNVDIENEKVSAHLDYLVVILTKIKEHVKNHPSSLSDTDQMMNYYLPMTMNLLENYKELDDGNLLGENRLKSKSDIEKTLYNLNDALNTLYDEMYQSTTMDVHADISVLETLLEQDGLKRKESSFSMHDQE